MGGESCRSSSKRLIRLMNCRAADGEHSASSSGVRDLARRPGSSEPARARWHGKGGTRTLDPGIMSRMLRSR